MLKNPDYPLNFNIRSAKLARVSPNDANVFLFIRRPLPEFRVIPPILASIEGLYFSWRITVAKIKQNYGVEFVNITVSTADKNKFDAWVGTQTVELAEIMTHIITSGYKLSVSLDQNNDCYICALTGTEDQRWNSKKCMTSRADSIEEAIWLAAYKHLVICDGGDWGESNSRSIAWG